MPLWSAAAAVAKKWQLSQTRRSTCCLCNRILSFPWLHFETINVLLMGGGGGGWGIYSSPLQQAHNPASRWGCEVFSLLKRLLKCKIDRKTWDASQKKKWHNREKLAWLLRQAGAAPECAAKLVLAIATAVIPTDFVVHRKPLNWKRSICFVEAKPCNWHN